MAANHAEHDREAHHQHGLQQHLHLHVRADAHAGAAQPARRVLHVRQDRLAAGAANSSSGKIIAFLFCLDFLIMHFYLE